MNTLKKLFWISRPISWPNTAYPFLAGAIMVSAALTSQNIILITIMTVFFAGPYNLLMYGVNDVFDYESDIKNPRKGGIEGMREERKFHPAIIKYSIVSTIPFVVYFVVTASFLASAALIILLFFVIAYSAPILRFKERPVLDSVTSSIHFVGPLIVALLQFGFYPEYWPFVIAFFLWGIASHALGAIQDIIPDREGKIHSIATVFGARTTMWIVVIGYLVAAALISLQGDVGIYIGIAGLLYVINVLPYLGVRDTSSPHVNIAWKRFLWINYCVGAIITIALMSILFSRS